MLPSDWRYVIRCQTPACGALAVYKVAAAWSDGVTDELKTYALTCPSCLPYWFEQACRKQTLCRLAHGETLAKPGIYELSPGKRDRELARRHDLEVQLLTNAPNPAPSQTTT
ncbi:MAG: hypothetical protein NZU63_14345 [Gemmataceae bacterium]|nr:hypothetical protein [Gemmataceae bacterium]MDW8244493.1 hypothetical protein [Thermogemmata sp.]